MAGGAPVPIPVSDSETIVLSIADLKEAASKKLPKGARGNHSYFSYATSLENPLGQSKHCLRLG